MQANFAAVYTYRISPPLLRNSMKVIPLFYRVQVTTYDILHDSINPQGILETQKVKLKLKKTLFWTFNFEPF